MMGVFGSRGKGRGRQIAMNDNYPESTPFLDILS
jgi:hypothetical protein